MRFRSVLLFLQWWSGASYGTMPRNAKGYRDPRMGSMHVIEGPCPAIIDRGPILNLAIAHHRRHRL
jgi:hypothetical protein